MKEATAHWIPLFLPGFFRKGRSELPAATGAYPFRLGQVNTNRASGALMKEPGTPGNLFGVSAENASVSLSAYFLFGTSLSKHENAPPKMFLFERGHIFFCLNVIKYQKKTEKDLIFILQSVNYALESDSIFIGT